MDESEVDAWLGEVPARTAGVRGLVAGAVSIARSSQERLERVATKTDEVLGDADRSTPDGQLVVQLLRELRAVPDHGIAEEMFTHLLVQASRANRTGDPPSSFPGIIAQMNPAEARILFLLKSIGPHKVARERGDQDRAAGHLALDTVRATDGPPDLPEEIENAAAFVEHLESQNLVYMRTLGVENTASSQTSTRLYTKVSLSQFGKLFADACIPDEWPGTKAPSA
ncbi:MAG: Abi-alpha family protein [Planctomycetota bacterium]|nr:Abi-alpha family protein [Planctomycetota bacterium]